MGKERFKITPAVYLILINEEDDVLLMQRQNTGYEDGNYGLPSGHKESGEYPSEAIVREVNEELGITVRNPIHVHTMFRVRDVDSERVDLFFVARRWSGEPRNAEPDKCKEIGWYPPRDLPENTIPYIREAINRWQEGDVYSEYEDK